MNRTLSNYKLGFISLVLIIGYAYLHLRLTPVLIELKFEQWISLSARLPFAQRLLVPHLAHYLNYYFNLSPTECFLLLELSFTGLLGGSLILLFKTAFPNKQAWLLSYLFIILLPLVTVLNYLLSSNITNNLYYPYDTASLFFMTIGFLLCLKQRWAWLALWIFMATLNRESSVLLVGLIPTLNIKNLRAIMNPLLMSLLAYFAARGLVFHCVHHLPGAWMEFYTRLGLNTNLSANLVWLFEQQNLLLFLFAFAGLPLLWFALYDYIPQNLRPIRYLTFFYFIALLFVGKIAETRIFGEIVLLLYFPICLAIKAWWTAEQPTDSLLTTHGFLFYCNRYAIIGLLLLMGAFHQSLATEFSTILQKIISGRP